MLVRSLLILLALSLGFAPVMAKPLSQTQINQALELLKAKESDTEDKIKLHFLLIQHAQEIKDDSFEGQYRESLETLLAKEQPTSKLRYTNLFAAGAIQYKQGRAKEAILSFQEVMNIIPLKDLKLRASTLQYLILLSRQQNNSKLEEKYLTIFVLSKGKSSDFYQSSGGFRQIIQLASKNNSGEEAHLYQEWYETARAKGTKEDQKMVLTEWVNYASSDPKRFQKEPFEQLMQLLEDAKNTKDLQELRLLYATSTNDDQVRYQLYEEVMEQDIKDKKETSLGILTRLLQYYSQQKGQEESQQKVLKVLAYRTDYDQKDEAIRRLAQISLKNKDWLTSLYTHQELLKVTPLDQDKNGVLLLNNLIYLTNTLQKQNEQLDYLQKKALTRTKFIEDEERFLAYAEAMKIYREENRVAEAEALYQKMLSAPYNTPPYPKEAEVHFLGAQVLEAGKKPQPAFAAYEAGVRLMLKSKKLDDKKALNVANHMRILSEQNGLDEFKPLDLVIEVQAAAGDIRGQAKTELLIAQKLQKLKKNQEAVAMYNRSLENFKKAKDTEMTNQILTLLLNLEEGNGTAKLAKLLDLEKEQQKAEDKSPLVATCIEIANLYSMQGEVAKARDYYTKAFGIKPRTKDSLMAGYYLGQNQTSMGQLEKANLTFDEVIKESKSSIANPQAMALIHRTYANNLSSMGRFEEAIKQTEMAYSQGAPELNFSILETRINILLMANQNDKAQQDIETQLKSATQDSQKQSLYLLLSRALMGSGKNQEAIVQLDKALSFSKDQFTDPVALKIQLRKAQAFNSTSQTDKAIQLLSELAEKNLASEDKAQLGAIYLQKAGYEIAQGKLAAANESNQSAENWSRGREDLRPVILMNYAKIRLKQEKVNEALKIFAELENALSGSTAKSILAELYYQRGYANLQAFNFDKAQLDFDKAYTTYTELKRSNEAIQSKMAQANVLMQLGKVQDAEAIYKGQLANATGEILGDINNALAFLYSEMGQYKKALEYSEKAEIAYQNANLTHRGPEVQNARGLIYLKMGDYGQAEVIFTKAIAENLKLNNPLLQAELTNNLGGLYKSKGDLEKAREQLLLTAELQKKLGFESQLALTYNNIGSVYLEESKYPEALDFLQKSREFSAKFNLKKELATSWNNEGILFFRQEKFEEAKTAFNEAIKLQRELELRLDLARTLNNLSIIASKENKIEEALNLVQEGVESLSTVSLKGGFYRNPKVNEILAPDLMKDFLQNKGGFLRMISGTKTDNDDKADYLDAAYQSFALSIDLIESLRSQIQASEAQQMLMQSNIDIFQQLISILYDLGELKDKDYHEKAFYYAEMSRARSFLDQLAEQAAKASLQLPAEIREREESLKGQIANLDQKIFVELKKPSGKRDEKLIQRWQLDKTELQIKYRKLTEEMEEKFPAFASLKYPKVYDLKDVRNDLLEDNSIAIVYFLGEDRSYGFSVTKKTFKMVKLPPNQDIDALIRKYRTTLVDPLIREDADDPELVIDSTQTHLVTGLQIYRQVLQPLLEEPNPKNPDEMIHDPKLTQLMIVPDGVLYYLPFETTLAQIHPKTDKRFAKGREYLLHRYAVNYSPSTSVLGTIKKQVKGRNPEELAKRVEFLGFGDPQYTPDANEAKTFKYNNTLKQQGFYEMSRLFNTIKELDQIKANFQSSQVVYMRDDALESNVKKSVGQAKYIHFATHGILDERNPEFSGVLMNLVKKDSDDGFLQASEIFELKLQSDLVVLSACETGLGKVIKGEGMVGLTRAFLFAGTPSIVVSLWTVADDSTSRLMILFYQKLSEGMDKDEALKAAKIELMSEEEDEEYLYNDPFYWGPFILNGTSS